MSDYHAPGCCSCATTVTSIDADCKCACHGPYMTIVCAWCNPPRPLRLVECASSEAGTKSHGICEECLRKQGLPADAPIVTVPMVQTWSPPTQVFGYHRCRKCGGRMSRDGSCNECGYDVS